MSNTSEPLFVCGDLNIHIERPDEPTSRQFYDVLAAHGLSCRVSAPTHKCGGTLDVVITRDDLPAPTVEIDDIGLSDHRLLRWTAPLTRPAPTYISSTCRPWRQLDIATFCDKLRLSPLCQPDTWSVYDIDDLAQLYDAEITAILDHLIPTRSVTCRRRPSDPWFDQDCRLSKRRVRLLERKSRRIDPADACAATAAAAAWTAEPRAHRSLLRLKKEAFWRNKVESEHSSPRKLWKTVDVLMGRGRVPLSTACRRCRTSRILRRQGR